MDLDSVCSPFTHCPSTDQTIFGLLMLVPGSFGVQYNGLSFFRCTAVVFENWTSFDLTNQIYANSYNGEILSSPSTDRFRVGFTTIIFENWTSFDSTHQIYANNYNSPSTNRFGLGCTTIIIENWISFDSTNQIYVNNYNEILSSP